MKEKKLPEELEKIKVNINDPLEYSLDCRFNMLANKINEIIAYLESEQ